MKEKIGVIGGGAWGTALTLLLAEKGHGVTLWMYEKDLAEEAARTRENRTYLPGFSLPASVEVTSVLETAVKGKTVILSVVPSHTVRAVAKQFAPFLTNKAVIISASKGIEIETLMPLSEVFKDTLPKPFHNRLCFLSGPSFAREVAQKMPTAVSLASYDPAIGKKAQEIMSSPFFRVYTNSDVMGVELGGSLKNVVAIAAGVLEGLGYGYNTMAALLTRGLAEMARLGTAMGANPFTFSGLAGMGDLVLTCTGDLSRNRTVGKRVGRGERIGDVLSGMTMVAEGVRTAVSAVELSRRTGVPMPISEQVHAILHEGKDAREAVSELFARALKREKE